VVRQGEDSKIRRWLWGEEGVSVEGEVASRGVEQTVCVEAEKQRRGVLDVSG
jgi:hypothetical protein